MDAEFRFDAPCPQPGAVRPDAIVVDGVTHTGKACRIVDNTASVERAALREVLDTLIRERRFGPGVRFHSSGRMVSLDRPLCSHVQFGERLYRILLFPYEARIEPF